MRRSISPCTLEAIEQASIGERFQTFDGNRPAGAILRQTFQSLTVSGWNRDVRVHAKSVDAGATRTGESVHAFRIDLICVTSHTRSGMAHSATHGGGIQTGQPRFIPHQRIGFFGIALGSQAPLLKKCSYPLGQQSCQSDNFFIAWSRQHLKLRLIPIVGGINAVYGKRVNMQVEPQSGVEALDERHRATLRIPHGAEFAGPFDETCKDCLGEDGKDIGHQARIVGQAVP